MASRVNCAAFNCTNSYYKNASVSFFRFPKEESRCKRWVQATRRDDLRTKSADYLYTNYRLCSYHFEPSQFMNPQKRNNLIWNAMPTVFQVPNPPKLLDGVRKPPIKRNMMPSKSSRYKMNETNSGKMVRVSSCSAYRCTSRNRSNDTRRFHRFPVNPALREKWIVFTRCLNWSPGSSARICSDHFTTDSYDRSKPWLMNKLKPNAIPTIFGFPEHLQPKESSENEGEDDKTNITKLDGDDCSTNTGEEELEKDSVICGDYCSTDNAEKEVEKTPVAPATAQGITSSDHMSNYQRRLTSNLFDFFRNNKFCDTVIDVQSKQQTSHKFYAHSVILAASNATLYEQLSSVVDSSLYMSSSLKPDIRFYIPIKDCDPVAVEISLRYIYTGQLVVPKSFSDETHLQSVLAACGSLGVNLSMLIGVRLVVEDKGEHTCSSTAVLGCQSRSTALGSSDENVEPDHQLLDVKIECDPETDDVHNSSSNSFECPASALKDGVDQDCVGILKVVQSGTATSLDHVVNTAFTIGEQTFQSASDSSDKSLKEASEKTCEKPEGVPVTIFAFPTHHQSMLSQPVAMEISRSTSNSDAVVASILRDHLYTRAIGVKTAPKRPSVCKICREAFYNVVEHRRHLRDSHAFVCQTCGFRVMSSANLKRHEATHKTTPRYSCQPCSMTFKTDIFYRSHRMKFHGIDTNSFLCHICGATFTTSTKLVWHSKKHLLPYKCEKCGKHYARKPHLNEHLLSCLTGGKKSFICDVCGAPFAYSSNLKRHMQSHRNGRAVCSECGKSYSQKQLLDLHLKECHKGGSAGLPAADKRCNLCGKAFVYKSTLDRHLLKHDMITGAIRKRGRQPRNGNVSLKKVPRDGPHKCSICNRGFDYPRTLANHMFVHREQKKYTCEICGKVLSDRRYLTTHLAVHRNKTYSCLLCDKLFRQPWYRDLHVRMSHCDQDTETMISNRRDTEKTSKVLSAEQTDQFNQLT